MEEFGWQQVRRRKDLKIDGPAGGAVGAALAVGIGGVRNTGVEGEIVAEAFRGVGGVRKMRS